MQAPRYWLCITLHFRQIFQANIICIAKMATDSFKKLNFVCVQSFNKDRNYTAILLIEFYLQAHILRSQIWIIVKLPPWLHIEERTFLLQGH